MITKQEIKKTLSEIKAIDKTFHICIADYELAPLLAMKMADKLDTLVRIIIKERNLSDWAVEDLEQHRKEMMDFICEEDETTEKHIFFGETYKLTSQIHILMTMVDVYVVQP